MKKRREQTIRDMINLLSICDDCDFGARFRRSFNRNDDRQLANIQLEKQRAPHAFRVDVQGILSMLSTPKEFY